jgi:hypothetical protein
MGDPDPGGDKGGFESAGYVGQESFGPLATSSSQGPIVVRLIARGLRRRVSL